MSRPQQRRSKTKPKRHTRRGNLPTDIVDPSMPCPLERDEKFVQLILKDPDRSASDIFLELCPHARRWKADSVYQNASKLKAKVQPRIDWLQEQATSKLVMNVQKRKELLSKIADEIGYARLGDYVEACGGTGAFVTYGPESPRPMAVQELHTMTRQEESGDAVTMTTKLKLHSKGDAISAVQELNKMEGVYKAPTIFDGEGSGVMIIVEPRVKSA